MPALRPRQAEDLARRLLARGARTKIVETHTGLSAYVQRSLRKDLGVDQVPTGPIPCPGGGRVSRSTLIHLSLFAVAYRRIGGNGVQAHINIDAVIDAHDIYRRSIEDEERLDINQAWMVARDLRSGWARLVACRDCAVDHLAWDTAGISPTCPFCAFYDRIADDSALTEDQAWSGST